MVGSVLSGVWWLLSRNGNTVDCCNFLDAWSLFADLSRSVAGQFDTDRALTNKIYDKIFWGNNLPAVTPDGEHSVPVWTNDELNILGKILDDGLSLFRNAVRHV